MGKKQLQRGLPGLVKISLFSLILLFLAINGISALTGNDTNETDIKAEAAVNDGQSAAFTVGAFSYTVVNENDKTVCITGIKPEADTKELVIPNQVTLQGSSYTVTDINFDSQSEQFEQIKTIQIPASITGKIWIGSSKLNGVLPQEADTLERPYCVPFPALEKVTFLGKTAPQAIYILSYLSGQDMIYQVPSGSEAAYEAVSQKSFSQPVLSIYDYEGDHTYMQYAVAPVIVSDTAANPEPHLFQTDKGIYMVTGSAAEGKGTAALILCRKLVGRYGYSTPDSGQYSYPVWDDYTIESEAAYKTYQYTVTYMKTGALLGFRTITMLTIPDTITEMEPNSIYAGNYLNFVFFSKNCKTISSDVFNSGENGAQNIAVFYVPTGVERLEGTFSSLHISQLYLPKGVKVSAKVTKACDKAVYYTGAGSDTKNSIELSTNKITAVVGTKKQIGASNTDKSFKDSLHYVSMDPGIASVTDSGMITPKHQGTAYILVFSEAAGAHQLIQTTVKNSVFTKGTFTYRINYSSKPEVTLISCQPAKSAKKLQIPSSVTYQGKTYQVTQICAGDYVVNSIDPDYSLTKGYQRIYATEVPLIADQTAKSSNITEVIIPATVKRTTASLGNLPKLKKIVFKGTTAPSLIALSTQNYNNAVLYIPKKAYTTYQKTNWKWKTDNAEYFSKYLKSSNIKLKAY